MVIVRVDTDILMMADVDPFYDDDDDDDYDYS